ncbi:ABC transporter ATP-binding protein [Cytobacillus depressus]|uniref:ABC transporter ATP-binding protein n=1 Tax=Cytobacillus depressus TaxID=1602942 RepID=A0A6L3V8P0_9BACI|nr:ABC transporter ATP-binding protein [Cytobacillus depressus]KAB2333315.1 ABC transporter ATP-binding protein [Cytobacillus depressus]
MIGGLTLGNLLEINNLKTYFYTENGEVPAVDGVSITVKKGETLGIVGESGSGKSVTALTAMRLSQGKVMGGSVTFNGMDLLALSDEEMRKIRGKEIAMIFQEPMTSLNPVFTVGHQIMEAIQIHMELSKSKAKERAIELLALVGIPRPERIVNEYPHRLSGGMRQRVMIAMAMSCNPSLLIADEPTTALDVTIQAQILDLMRELKKNHNTSIIMITHDLGVVAETCDRVCVMYGGKVVEESGVQEIFNNPKHPYTQGLLKSVPTLLDSEEQSRLYSIEGNVPIPGSLHEGCYFAPRCEFAMDKCRVEAPAYTEVEQGHFSRCWLHEMDGRGGLNDKSLVESN